MENATPDPTIDVKEVTRLEPLARRHWHQRWIFGTGVGLATLALLVSLFLPQVNGSMSALGVVAGVGLAIIITLSVFWIRSGLKYFDTLVALALAQGEEPPRREYASAPPHSSMTSLTNPASPFNPMNPMNPISFLR